MFKLKKNLLKAVSAVQDNDKLNDEIHLVLSVFIWVEHKHNGFRSPITGREPVAIPEVD